MANQSSEPEDKERQGSASRASPYDVLNMQIVKLLQADGRMSFREIAERLKISEGTVRNRVAWMKEAGALTIAAIVDPTAIHYKSDAMLGIKTAPGRSPADVAERLKVHSEVVYILWVSGRYDLLVEVVVDSQDALTSFLIAHCYSAADIASIEVMTGLQMYKNQFLLKRELD